MANTIGRAFTWCRNLFHDSGAGTSAAVIVAHPDDETLWAGGLILTHPRWHWFVLSLCRGSDPDRSPKFWRALSELGADGAIADLDDGPEQLPLDEREIRTAIECMLPQRQYDYLVTHSPTGEYTRHRRHEEVSRAAINLWLSRTIRARSLLLFAYEDGGRSYMPRARRDAHLRQKLDEATWHRKHELIRRVYDFTGDSWEAKTTPRTEAFWLFDSPRKLNHWLVRNGDRKNEGTRAVRLSPVARRPGDTR